MRNHIPGPFRHSLLFLWIVPLILLVLFSFGCDQHSASEIEKIPSDEELSRFLKEQYFEVPDEPLLIADFEYSLLNGEQERLSSNRGKIVFLNFWATWCYPCQKEMPDMQQLADQLKDEPFRILAVNYGEELDRVERFADKFHYSFDIIMDKEKAISAQLAVKGLPTTLIIDRQGRLMGKLMGPANWSRKAYKDFFKSLTRK
jgi:thiol-disulfide isomerase/thioredoxin